MRALTRLVFALVLIGLTASVFAANQTINFAGLVIPGGITSSFQWDGFQVSVAGGSQPYMQQSSGIRFGTVAPNENITMTIRRIDNSDFTLVSVTGFGLDENSALSVAGYNNGALVGSAGSFPANPSNNTTSTTVNFGAAVVDELRLSGQTSAAFAGAGELLNFVISVSNLPPTLNSYAGSRNYTTGGAAITLDGGTAATITDSDSTDFNGGYVLVTGFSGEVAAQDNLQVGNVSPISVNLSTGEVSDAGTVIGQVVSNGQSGADLRINLNGNSTIARVQNLIRALQYYNSELTSPYIHARTLQTMVSDGDGASPSGYNTTINYLLPADPVGSQKVNFNAGTMVPDISSNIATSITSQGFVFTISGGFGAYLQSGFNFPGSPSVNMGTTGGGTITTTITRTAVGTDFSLGSLVFGNSTSQNGTVEVRLNGASVQTRTVPGTFAQQLDFGGITVDEIRITGNSSASGFFQAGAFDELVYFPANLSPTVGSLQGDTSTYTQGDASVNLDASTAATVVDTDSPDFNGGSLTLAIVQNRWTGQDVLQIGNVGTISLSGNNVVDNGTTIGTVAGGTGSNNLVVTFNANATPARVQNLVRALQYRNTEANQPDLGDRSVVMTLLDGDGSSPSETSMTVRVRPSALPAGRVVELNYTGLGTQPVNTTQVTFQSYRATISGGFQPYLQAGFDGPSPTSLYGGDTGISSQSISLVRSDNADFFGYAIIVGNFNSAVALTLTTRNNGSAVQTVSVPAGGTQRVLLNDTLAIDQIVLSGSVSSTNGRFAFIDELAVKPPNTPPTLGGSSGNLSYTENAAATAIDAALTVTDPDNNFNGGTLRAQLTGNASAADQLSILSGGTVTVSGSNVQVSSVTKGTVAANPVTGGTALVVTFNSSATTADVQAIARAIAFFNSSDTPSTAQRTVTYTVTDAATTSGTRTRLIDVTSVNDAPALANAGALIYTENQSATPINGSLTVSDADNATLASATVSFTLNYVNGQDVLGFVNVPGTMGNISGSFVPGTGVLSLSSAGATATLAQWQAALRAVTYFNASDAPSTAARNVSYAVNDGNTGSLSQLNVVTVNAQNDLPVLANAGVASYSEDAPPVRLNDLVTISDLDHSTLAGATITITANLANTQDVLVFTANPATMGNIAGSYVSTSGVLTLTSAGATATLSQWQEALRAVSYQNTSNNPSTAIRGISMVVNDGQVSSLALANTVSVVASNDAPTLSGGIAAQTYTENAPPTFVNPDIVVVDDDNATLATATVTITAGLAPADDVLDRAHNPATMGNIVSTYTSSTGTMQLSSAGNTATTAQWQAALRAVTYSNSSDNPGNATRTIAIAVNDGDLVSAPLTRNMTVNAQNDQPVLANAGVASYSEDGPPVQLNDLVTVNDVDHSTLASATITITANLANTQDVLVLTANPATMGNIAGNYVSASGVLTLTSSGATATLSQWQAALRAVAYQNTSNNPSTAIRGISMVVNDGQGSSLALANTVSVVASNDAPTLSGGIAAQTYIENAPPTSVNPDIVVADDDNATLATATVTITAGLAAADDVLERAHNPATMGNIASTYTSSTGTMQLSSAGNTATTAQWQAALRAVTYSNSSDNPSNATRTISIVVNDGDLASVSLARNMNVNAQNDPPAISAASTVSFVEGGTAILASPGLIIADPDNATLRTAQVQLTTGFAGSEDVLSFSNDGLTMGNIVGNYVPANGLLDLSSAGGTATVAEWQSALRAVRYQNTSENPSVTTRALQVTANDGQATGGPLTGNIMVQAINDPPTLSNASSISYAENNAPTVINGVLLATDVDNNTLASATVTVVGGFAPDQDVLGLNIDPGTMGNISAAYDPGTGTLNVASAGATASLPQWLNALHAITYFNSSDNPSTVPRTVQFVINDGTDVAPPVTSTITLTAENDAPVLASTSTVGFIEDGAPVTINPTLEVSDADSATLASATVSIVQNLVSTEDVLSLPAGVASANDLTESYDAASGTLTLTAIGGTTAPAAWQNVLRAVRYENTSENPSTSTRELRFVIRDAALPSNALGSSVSVTASNDAPILSGTSTAGFTENDAAVPVNQNLTIADIDNTTLASATISIGSGFDTGDTLAFVNDGASMGNISGSYAGNTLSLSSAGATASLLQWQAALRAVTFGTASDAPSIATRTVSFVINDGQDSSSVVDSTISMTAVNDPPTLSVPLGLSVQEDGLGTLGAIDVQDPDVGGGTMRLQLSSSQGVLAAAPGAGVTITGSPGAAITAEGTRLNLANWLAGPVLQFSPSNNLFGAATIALEVSDLGNDPGPAATATAAISVQIAAVPDADLIAVLSNDVSVVWVGDSVIYNAVLKNNGPEGVALADGVRAQFAIPAGLTDVTWTCEGSDGGACSASGTGAINDPIVLPDGGSVSYLITATVTPGLSAALSASFGFTASPALQSDVLTNNLATDTDELRLFRNSFE